MSSTRTSGTAASADPECEAVQRLQEQLEHERAARREDQAVLDAVLEATSQDLYQKNLELSKLNAELEERVRSRTTELAHAVAAAERADAAKSEFLARMSHEIRTPMNGVLGMLDVLRGSVRDPQQSGYVQTAYASATSLLRIIDDILDFSKIEAGKLELEALDFDLHAVTEQVVRLWTQEAGRRRLSLELNIGVGVPQFVTGDPTRLMQVLSNLVSNALKFTSRGFVRIHLERAAPATIEASGCLVRFTVEDSGSGIADEVQGTLFSAFTQADTSISRRYGGSGLGLAICKQLTEMMGGEMAVKSTLGSGTRFWFTLPFAASNPALERSTADARAASVPAHKFDAHVLVVDDNEVNREVAGVILQSWGCSVSYAVDGREALEMVRDTRPALVLMDCHMPGLDGFECTTAIRSTERGAGAGRLPIVGVSASTLREERDRCAACGMDDFLPKPITVAAVGAALQRYLGATARSTARSNHSATEAPPGDSRGLLDLEHLQEMRSAAGPEFPHLLNRFHAGAQEQIEAMRAAVLARDAGTLRRLAHKLKGASSSLGACALTDVCAQVEQQGARGDLASAAELQRLSVTYAKSYAALMEAARAGLPGSTADP